jgi:hypothetical protein
LAGPLDVENIPPKLAPQVVSLARLVWFCGGGGMTKRQHQPDRSHSEVVAFEHQGRHCVTASRFPDGGVAEIFVDAEKSKAPTDLVQETAILASLALQHGCTVETMRHALRGRSGSPLTAALTLIDSGL